jgi:MFS transporter, putative metabolite:H+ symporter
MSSLADLPEPQGAQARQRHANGAVGKDVAAEITAAIERLPNFGWRPQAAAMLGLVTLAGGIASAAPNYGLASLASSFGVGLSQPASLTWASFVAQLLGALLFGWSAGRHGRIPALLGAIATFGLASLLCAAAWDLRLLVVFRGLQGAGLAGEATVAATYLIEFLGARDRGHVFLFYQISLPLGVWLASFLGPALVSTGLGWRALFLLGALPLASLLYLWRLLPESPLWLAAHGRSAEAFKELATLTDVDPAALGPAALGATALGPAALAIADEPAPAGQKISYAGRIIVVLAIWLIAAIASSTLLSLAPGLYRAAYNAPSGPSGGYALIMPICSLVGMVFCARRIDSWGRRRWFVTSFACASLVFGAAATGLPIPLPLMFTCFAAAYFFTATFSVTVYLYVLELFPTRVRALALAGAIVWSRLVALLASYGLSWIGLGLSPAYLAVAVLAAAGATIAALFAIETKGRPLHQIAPD